MASSKIQMAAKLAHELHSNVFIDEGKHKSVFDKLQKMTHLFDGADLHFTNEEKELLYCATYLYYLQNPKLVENGKEAPRLQEIQKTFGSEVNGLVMSFTHTHTPEELSQDEIWTYKCEANKEKKLAGDVVPENKIAELIMMAELAVDLMNEQPAFHCGDYANRTAETLSKLIVASKLRTLSPYLSDVIEKEGVRLLCAYVPLWQKKMDENGDNGNIFAHLVRSSFAEVQPQDSWDRDVGRRVDIQTYVETPDKEEFNYNLNAKDDYLGDRTRVILTASKQAGKPVPVSYAADLLYYTLTTFPDQGEAYNTAATGVGIALVDYIADNADVAELPDLLLKEMPPVEGLETLVESVNAKTYLFDSAAMKDYSGTPRAAQDCYDLKEAVLMSYNPFIVNRAHQKLAEKRAPHEVNVNSFNETDELLAAIMARRAARRVRS